MLDRELIEETDKILNEIIKDKIQGASLSIDRVSGNAPLITQKDTDRFNSEKPPFRSFRDQIYGARDDVFSTNSQVFPRSVFQFCSLIGDLFSPPQSR